MSSSINIYPFSDNEGLMRFGIQTFIFLIGVYVAHKFIIKPALRLHTERSKRTVGNNEAAKLNIERAKELEHEYFTRLKEGAIEAQNLRSQEILAAQQLAHSIITETQHKSNEQIKAVRGQLLIETNHAKEKLTPLLDDIISTVYKKLGLSVLLVSIGSLTFLHSNIFALEENLVPSFWYSVFWPYFQFFIFIIAIIYFAKKPLKALLEQRRDDFRAKLSEAHEAVYLADKKIKEYEAKVASLEYELNELKQRNLEDAQLEKKRILEEANKASEMILKDSERTIVELINNSRDEIKKELFTLAINEVEKRLDKEKLMALDQKYKQEALDNIKSLN